MNPWQDVIVVGLISGATIYLARVFWRRLFRHGNAGCDTCFGCPSRSRSKGKQDDTVPVSIQSPSRNAGEQ